MVTTMAIISRIMQAAKTARPGLQPAILMHKNIDHNNVAEYTNCYVNDSWAQQLKELIDTGWVVFHIQTEFHINGHETHAYLAKMKSD